VKQQLQVIERGALVVDEGVVLQVVQVGVALERGDQHPLEGETEDHGEEEADGPHCDAREPGAGATRGHLGGPPINGRDGAPLIRRFAPSSPRAAGRKESSGSWPLLHD